jgi:transcriptional regulator with XRE-family HTH domain
MSTLETPVRKTRDRLDYEVREAQEALDMVVVWHVAGSGKSEAAVRLRNQLMHGEPERMMSIIESEEVDTERRVAERWKAYKELRSIVRKMAAEQAWRENPIAQELLDQTFELEERLEQDPTGTDPDWRVKEVVDHIGDLVATLAREVDHGLLDEPAIAAQFALDALKGIDQEELADLFDVDARTIRTWKSGQTKTIRKNPERVTLIAQLIYDLRRAMTPRGIVMWFRRDRPQLGGRSPLELIEEDIGTAEESLRSLARGVRGQLAS